MESRKKASKTASKKSARVKGAPKPIMIRLKEGFTREDLLAKLTPPVVKRIQAAHTNSRGALVDFNKFIP